MTAAAFQQPLHILGAGSIGKLWAASIRSTFPTFSVTLLLRSSHRSRIDPQSSQVKVSLQKSPQEQPLLVQVPATFLDTRPKELLSNVIVTTKAYQAVDAVQSLLELEMIGESTRVILLCNGALSVRDKLKEKVSTDWKNLILGTTTNGAYQNEMSKSDDLYYYNVVKTFLEHHNPNNSDLVDLANLWTQSGLNCQTLSSRDMDLILWQKLAANCVINPLTALHQCYNGDLLLDPSVPEILHHVIEEVSQVAQQVIPQTEESNNELSEKSLQNFVYQVMEDTRSNKSSMLQDVIQKKQTEVDDLNGYIVRKGRELGLECPANEELCERIKELARNI
jgi:2-dehydropantoate 2-reductase